MGMCVSMGVWVGVLVCGVEYECVGTCVSRVCGHECGCVGVSMSVGAGCV